MRPLIPRVLSCQRHGWPSISTWRCRQALAAYPKASDEQSSNAFCLALLPMRLAMRPTVTSGPVVSYTAVSPLPTGRNRSGGLFSAALSLRSPWADVIRHRALWSPEVPQPTDRSRPSRGLKCTMIAKKRTKGKSKKLYFSCVNFSVKSQCCGYNVDYRTAKQLFGPYIAGNTA